jgi:hypothetical protein
MSMDRPDDERTADPVIADGTREGEPKTLGWIRRFADQWAEARRDAQKAHDLPGDSLRK